MDHKSEEHEKDRNGEAEPTWNDYYEWLKGREPRPLFLEAFERFRQSPTAGRPMQAVDLGFGDGTETLAMLAAGWRVLAVDNEPAAITRLETATPAKHRPRLDVKAVPFEQVELPNADLVYAGLSLPFCRPDYFEGLWRDIRDCLRPGGRFAGQLFGVRDARVDSPYIMSHSLEEVERLLATGLEVETFREIDEEREAFVGPEHWHMFEIIVRKKRNNSEKGVMNP
jgi:SAM-dependent methyltransferase